MVNVLFEDEYENVEDVFSHQIGSSQMSISRERVGGIRMRGG
jgi:hypothetical protein